MSEELRAQLGYQIRRFRMLAGRSQEWLAEKAGIHRNSILRYEKGDEIPLTVFISIAQALEVSVDAMIKAAIAATAGNEVAVLGLKARLRASLEREERRCDQVRMSRSSRTAQANTTLRDCSEKIGPRPER